MYKPTPKFTTGQVVWVSAEKRLIKIGYKSLQGSWAYWPEGSGSVGYRERGLRKLTKRERGSL